GQCGISDVSSGSHNVYRTGRRTVFLGAGPLLNHSIVADAPEPLDESAYPFFNLSLRVIAQQTPGLLDVGKGLRDVSRLRWLLIDYGVCIQLLFKQRYQLPQLDCS